MPRRALVLVLLAACGNPAPGAPPPEHESADAPTAPAAPAAGPAAPPRIVKAPRRGSAAEAVVAEQAGAPDDLLVVYVGAAWCEPCVAFHAALDAGALDADFPGVRFLEFDLDRDRERLAADGYSSQYVPLFAFPGADGRASGDSLQGGVKGPGAAANIVARLKPLIDARRRP
ncbi:MAG: thioredoxin [Myxococcales bacterium]|nr:thioredoxin [Myxococcales bacterium]